MPNAKMRQVLIIIVLTTCTFFTRGQNLVPNPSFELHSNCPSAGSQINYSNNWYNGNGASVDYFNSCATNSSFSVPLNSWGTQIAHSGNAYAGLTPFGAIPGPSAREYLQVQLTDSLIKDYIYCASFFVSLTDASNTAITEFGMYVSNIPTSSSNYLPLPFNPQIISPSSAYLSDQTNWMEITGTYIAQGGEKYIIIGNFKDDISTDTLHWGIFSPVCYYFIDDVSLTLCDSSASVKGYYENALVKIFPNPFTHKTTLQFDNSKKENCTLLVYNIHGQVVRTITKITKDQVEIERLNLVSGLYYYQLHTDKQVVATGKLMIE